jgi:Raf kinase inhibitor-like YbhB/YbcL family protein
MIEQEVVDMSLKVTSTAFSEGAAIPTKFTCDGEDVSPPLAWSGVPEGTRSVALISDDPDAPGRTWVHWVLYRLQADAAGLPEAVPKTDTLPNGARHGTTDFGRREYGGPCPPPGSPHRYFFKVYALDGAVDLEPGATKGDLLSAMDGHTLAQGELMGTYRRR